MAAPRRRAAPIAPHRSCAEGLAIPGSSAQDHLARDGAGVDARLAVGAAAAWLSVILCLGHAPAAVLAVAALAAAIGLSGLLVSRRGARHAAALALAAFCVVLVLLPLAGRTAHERASPLWQLATHHLAASVELTVTADPRPLAATGVAGSPRAAVDGRASRLSFAGRTVQTGGHLLILAPAQLWRGVLPGQRVRIDGTLRPPLKASELSVTLFAQTAPVLIGRPPWWQRDAGVMRRALQRACAGLPDGPRGLLPGLVDGDTTGLDPVLAERFRLAGLTHLVAVSGTNCSILVGAVLLALRRARARPAVCAAAAATVLVAFVVLARPSPSVLRAAAMAGIALAGLASGRPRQALPALSAATILLLVLDAGLADDPGFTMSVLATAGLLVIAPGWAEALRRRRVPALVAEGLAVAATAHLVTAPVIAALSGRVSLVAIPANVLAEPVVVAVTVLGFAAAVVAPVWLGGGSALTQLAGWPCRWLVRDAEFFGGLHGATVPWPGGAGGGLALLALACGAVVAAQRVGVRPLLGAAAVAAVIVQIPVRAVVSGWPPPGWLFVACDVGQGDALVLPAGRHAAVAIDAGPDPVAVDRCLRDLGVTSIPLLVFTHYHLDHVGGIAGVFHNRSVGRAITGPLAEPLSGQHTVQEALWPHRLGIEQVTAGQSFDIGDVRLDVLGPAAAFRGTRSDPNNSSVVLRATVHGHRILLPGDAEIEAQQALLRGGADLRADVLKVPHHGSAYSTPAFLAAVHAELAVISVGLHNDYGHPSPLLLGELARLGLPVRRTDRDGDVAVTQSQGTLVTVSRGTRASTVGLARPAVAVPSASCAVIGLPPSPCPTALRPTVAPATASEAAARMSACPPAPSAWTTCPSSFRASCCSSATRSSSSAARSARSPPPHDGRLPTPPTPSASGASSRGPSCTNCWGPRYSPTREWS
jgi:competence protein ComEC